MVAGEPFVNRLGYCRGVFTSRSVRIFGACESGVSYRLAPGAPAGTLPSDGGKGAEEVYARRLLDRQVPQLGGLHARGELRGLQSGVVGLLRLAFGLEVLATLVDEEADLGLTAK